MMMMIRYPRVIVIVNNKYIERGHKESSHSRPGGGHTAGSYPEPPQGVHREILHAVIIVPLATPYSVYASIAYAEHVGWNRQDGGNRGDITVLYMTKSFNAILHTSFVFLSSYAFLR